MLADRAADLPSGLERELLARYPVDEAECQPGFRLLSEGCRCEHMYLLTRGAIKLSFIDRAGREFILSLRSATRAVGIEAAVLDVPSLCSATAVTPCLVRKFPAKAVRQFLRDRPEVSFHASHSLSWESIEQTTALMELVSRSARQRLLTLLRRLHGASAGSTAVELGEAQLKRHELAKLLGVTPEHLSRLLRALRRDGLLQGGTGRIVLSDCGGGCERYADAIEEGVRPP
jgi:CRP/FNR family cyclic AMP-dependent transcriptional regulator